MRVLPSAITQWSEGENLPPEKPFAFVLMPMDAGFDDIYKLGIQAAATDLDVIAERVDEQFFSEPILERIFRQIDAADFVIADMTGRNPNVFYEVGYTHAKGKLCTLLTQNTDDIPFDLRHHRHVVYGNSISKLKAQLKAEIEWLKREVERRHQRTITVRLRSIYGLLIKENWAADAEVEIVLDLHNTTSIASPEIQAMYYHTGPGWKFRQNNEDCPSADSEISDYSESHFIRPPASRLAAGSWAQVKLIGRKRMGSKFKGDELQDAYRLSGHSLLEIMTSEGAVREQITLDLLVDELPF